VAIVLAGYRNPKQTRVERVGRRQKGRALTDDEMIKVCKAAGIEVVELLVAITSRAWQVI
jgi:hypothetical protein